MSTTTSAGVIAPLIDREQMGIQKWFFIRYTENGHHLRLRIEGDEQQLGALIAVIKKQTDRRRV